MRAFRITAFDAPPELAEIPAPKPGPGEVQLRIAACGLNFADLLMQKGQYQERPALPFTLGMEAAGIVTAVGTGVTQPALGARVAVFVTTGGLAEQGCFPAERCLPLPDSLTFVQAAAFQIAYGTSHLALDRRAQLQPGETLLVLGAAGGVGLTAVEIGKLMGARVIAVARGADRLAAAKAAGADHLIDTAGLADDAALGTGLRDALRDLGGVDVVYDPVGGAAFTAALRATRPEGRILAIGFASGTVPPVPANLLLVKNISVIGHYWGGYAAFAPGVLAESLATLLRWQEEGRLTPHVSHTLPLGRAAEALDLLRARAATGKIVVTME